jgi:hypothetical protein
MITPAAVTAAIASSTLSVLASSRQTAGSIRPIAAVMMTAPSTALGRSAIGAVKNSRTSRIAPAASRPAIWLRAPMLSLTAVREPLGSDGQALGHARGRVGDAHRAAVADGVRVSALRAHTPVFPHGARRAPSPRARSRSPSSRPGPPPRRALGPRRARCPASPQAPSLAARSASCACAAKTTSTAPMAIPFSTVAVRSSVARAVAPSNAWATPRMRRASGIQPLSGES